MAENRIPSSGSKTYYSIIEGEIRRKAKPGDDEQYIRKRVNKSQQEVQEFAVGALTGRIKNVAVIVKDFNGKKISNLELDLEDVGEVYQLQIPVESKYFGSLVEKLPNLDYNQYVNVSVYDWTPAGEKRKTGVSIKQNNNKVPSFYSKENPLPGVGDFPRTGEDEDVKLWGIQRTKALKKVVESENLRLRAPQPTATPQVANHEPDDLPF